MLHPSADLMKYVAEVFGTLRYLESNRVRDLNQGMSFIYRVVYSNSPGQRIESSMEGHYLHYQINELSKTIFQSIDTAKYYWNHTQYLPKCIEKLTYRDNKAGKDSSVSYLHARNYLARDLGFDDAVGFVDWAKHCPELWGNDHGEIMFISARAYGKDKDFADFTFEHIADHLSGVADRLADREKRWKGEK